MYHTASHRGRRSPLPPAAALLLALCLLAVGVQAMTGPMNTAAPVAGAVLAAGAAADAGAPAIDWQACLGGTQADSANDVQQTADGGYIVAGYTYSKDGDVTGYHGGTNQHGYPYADARVARLNATGGLVWQRCLGGTGGDSASAVQQTTDGGYIVAGGTSSVNGDVTGNHGSTDAWVVKLNATGAVIWQKCLGGGGIDTAKAVQQTADGGYIVAGSTASTDGDVTGSHGGYGDSAFDAWVVKLNATGGLVWQKCLGGTDRDGATAVQQTADGGYIVAGSTSSNDGDVSGVHGGTSDSRAPDIWVVKLDAAGSPAWQKCLGGTGTDEDAVVRQTADGGYIVAGKPWSTDGDVSGHHGGYFDFWVVKLDAAGSIVWQTCLGGSGEDIARAIQQTADGGYIVAGTTQSTNGDVSGVHGGYGYTPVDAWVVKLDATGSIVWQKCLGGSSHDRAFAARQTADGGYVIAGETFSADGDVAGIHGESTDAWVVKLGAVLVPPTTKPPADDLPATGYETPIVVRDDDQVGPVVNGSRVVWQDWRNGASAEGDIYSYDLASRLELPEGAASSDYGKFIPHDYDPAVSSAGIFWVHAGRSDADINNEVRGRTLGGETLNITTGGEPGYRIIRDLAIDGDRLVYVLGEYGLVRYDTTHGGDYFVRSTENEIRSPDISGGTIVWQEYDGNDWNIFWYKPLTGSARALANDPWDQVAPAIHGTRAVWADHRSGNWDLYTADLSQPNPVGVPLVVAPGDQTNPQLSGDRVVWQDNRNGDWDIYSASVPGGAVATVCTAPGDQRAPAIDDDRVVWEDHRNGNWDVYMFTLSSTGPVPVPTPAPLVITSPGTYAVAADGYDGKATPIEIRSSNVVLDGGNHTVDGSRQRGSCGVRITGPVSNVVVRNLRLTNWEAGIQVENATASAIEDCEVEHNGVGVLLEGARDVAVRGNRIAANDDLGLGVDRSANASLLENDVLKTGDGFDHLVRFYEEESTFAVSVGRSAGTVVSGNEIDGEYGSLHLVDAAGTRVTGNRLLGARSGLFGSYWGRNEGTIVFDNLFRNRYYNVYGAPNATWNTTPSPGPNIVGGPEIGGNFWAKLDGTGFSETHPDVDRDGFCDDANPIGDALPLAPWDGPAPGPTPYRPHTVPCRIEAEDYDYGGFSDTTPGNAGGAYRTDDVDIEAAGGITNVGWIRNGEWLTYTVNVTTAGKYTLTARTASPNTGRSMTLSVDGAPTATIAVPNTGSFATYRDATPPLIQVTATQTPVAGVTGVAPFPQTVALTAGRHTLKLTFQGDGQNLDWFELAPYVDPTPLPPTPNGSTGQPYPAPHAVPGRVEAEDYDLGGVLGHHAGQRGRRLPHRRRRHRGRRVNFNVGWVRAGEYLEYSVDSAVTDPFSIALRVANPGAGQDRDRPRQRRGPEPDDPGDGLIRDRGRRPRSRPSG